MTEAMKKFWGKYREFIAYIIVGAATTLIAVGVYFLAWKMIGIAFVATAVSWCVAVVFAFFANKFAVFRSGSMCPRTVTREFLLFVGCRAGTLLFDMFFLYVTVDFLAHTSFASSWPAGYSRMHALVMKGADEVIGAVVNYWFGKFWIFVKKGNAAHD